MNAPADSRRPGGNGVSRFLLGATGVFLAASGVAIELLAVLSEHFPYATPLGFFMVSVGVVLIVVCAFYDEVEIVTGGPTILKIKVKRSQDS